MTRFLAAMDETSPTAPLSALALFLLRSNRALKVGPGGVRYSDDLRYTEYEVECFEV